MGGLVVLYVVTGILQPTLVDFIKYQGGAGRPEPPLLLPTLSTTLAMALVGVLPLGSSAIVNTATGHAAGHVDNLSKKKKIRFSGGLSRGLFVAAAIDLLSGLLLTAGLLLTGSSVFVVIYGSNTLWTAVLAWCLSKKQQSVGQWMGIGILSIGLLVNAAGNHSLGGTAALDGLWGSALVLAGTLLHSLYFIGNYGL